VQEDIVIRRCAPADVEAVSCLLSAVWHDTYDKVFGVERVNDITQRWHSADVLRGNLEVDDACFLVAETDSRICGTAYSTRADEKNTVTLHRLYVSKDLQGGGVGLKLLNGIVNSAHGGDVLLLEVEPSNTRAIGFYERAGFRKTGRGTDCGGVGDGIPHIIMERAL